MLVGLVGLTSLVAGLLVIWVASPYHTPLAGAAVIGGGLVCWGGARTAWAYGNVRYAVSALSQHDLAVLRDGPTRGNGNSAIAAGERARLEADHVVVFDPLAD